ncbi:MAG: hypothetical protein PWP68_499, partial [Rikenellaceae bacterium]|nr:hypothetical protein [Rikenellaceae bacterium]
MLHGSMNSPLSNLSKFMGISV